MAKDTAIIPIERIEKRILLIRDRKVMLDADLAELYGVETRILKQAVRRNIDRFPEDFMFELTWEEVEELQSTRDILTGISRSQIVTLKRGSNIKYRPFVFTEQGVAMLSSVLNSTRAIQVNIAIMRAFVRLREMLAGHKELAAKLAILERKLAGHDKQILSIVQAIKKLTDPKPLPKKRRIGFNVQED